MKLASGFYAYPKGRKFALWGWSCNVFAIPQPGGDFLLVDAGSASFGKAKRLKRALRLDGFELGDLRAVVLTHAHVDHYQAVPSLLEDAPNAEVWVHKADAAALSDPAGAFEATFGGAPGLERAFVPFGAVKLAKKLARWLLGSSDPVEPDRLLEDGDVLGDGPGALRVVHTPGHSPGHCSYLLENSGVLLSGDVVDPAFDDKPVLNLPTSDFGATRESIERLLDLKPTGVATSHGDVGAGLFLDGQGAATAFFSHALEHLEGALGSVRKLLETRERVRFAEFADAIDQRVWTNKFERLTTALAVLKFLERRGEVRREDDWFARVG
ncbi:MAG: hypothetical protein Kow0069_17260 [Promethearchaeota archaeon]